MNGVFIHLAAYIVFLSTQSYNYTGVVMSIPEPFSKARNNILCHGEVNIVFVPLNTLSISHGMSISSPYISLSQQY